MSRTEKSFIDSRKCKAKRNEMLLLQKQTRRRKQNSMQRLENLYKQRMTLKGMYWVHMMRTSYSSHPLKAVSGCIYYDFVTANGSNGIPSILSVGNLNETSVDSRVFDGTAQQGTGTKNSTSIYTTTITSTTSSTRNKQSLQMCQLSEYLSTFMFNILIFEYQCFNITSTTSSMIYFKS